MFFQADERVQPALLAQLALDAEKRVIEWKIVSSACRAFSCGLCLPRGS